RSLEEGRKVGRPVKVFFHSHLDCGAYFSAEDAASMTMGGNASPTYELAYLVTAVDRGEVTAHRLFVWDVATRSVVEGPFGRGAVGGSRRVKRLPWVAAAALAATFGSLPESHAGLGSDVDTLSRRLGAVARVRRSAPRLYSAGTTAVLPIDPQFGHGRCTTVI